MLSLVLGVYQIGYGFNAVHPCCQQLKLFIQNVDMEKAKFYFGEVSCRPTWKTKHNKFDSDAVVGLSSTEGGKWTGIVNWLWSKNLLNKSQNHKEVFSESSTHKVDFYLSVIFLNFQAFPVPLSSTQTKRDPFREIISSEMEKAKLKRGGEGGRERNDLERKMLIYCKMRTKWNNPQPLSWHELFLVPFCICLLLLSTTVFLPAQSSFSLSFSLFSRKRINLDYVKYILYHFKREKKAFTAFFLSSLCRKSAA